MLGAKMTWIEGMWRRDGDSNPGGAFTPTRFPGVRLKPLGHPSRAGLPPDLMRRNLSAPLPQINLARQSSARKFLFTRDPHNLRLNGARCGLKLGSWLATAFAFLDI